jgi:tape measure domain-containing protein
VASTEDDVVVRLRLKDVKQFVADVKAGKLAIDDLEKKVKKAGQTASRESSSSGGFGKLASHFGFLKYAAVGVVGSVAAAGAGIVGYAVKSAASLEQVKVAFTTLLHSASAANTMVANLQKFAQTTPFELAGVEQSTQKLLAMGFSAKSIIPTLTAVGNAASGLNIGQAGMDEIILALGQTKKKGRLQGDELMQLSEHGVDAYTYLEKALKLTPTQLQKAVQAGKVSAGTAIPIILRGMNQQFHGLMDAESHTLGGMWSNFHDAAQQGLMKLANPFMPAMKRWLGEATTYLGGPDGKSGFFARASKFMAVLPGNVTSGRADFAAYNIGAIIGNHRFDPAIEKGVRVVHNLGVIVKDVLAPAFKDLSVLLAPAVALLDHLDSITGFIADHSTAFRAALDLAVGGFIAYKGIVLGINGALKLMAFWEGVTELATIKFAKATDAQRVALLLWKGVMLVVTGVTKAWTWAQWLLNFAMDANPIGAVVLAVAGLVAAFVFAYKKVKWFRDLVDGLWDDLKGLFAWMQQAGDISTWSSHGAATAQTIDPSKVGGATGVVAQNGGSAAHPGPLISLMGHASGGTMTQTHTAWVGEKGPELLTLPRGSSVIPLPRVPEFAGGRHIEIPVVLNGREIARAVYDDMDDRMARR